MVETWKKRLRTASFRGVEFELTVASLKAGRRTARHEYPLRDVPAVEDMGRATREIRLDGFVVGDDYMSQRDRLLAACETPGAGVLVHPYFGRLRVVCEACEVVEQNEEGRTAGFRLAFIESGALQFPTGKGASSRKVDRGSSRVKSSAVADFVKAFNTSKGSALVKSAAASFKRRTKDLRKALSRGKSVVSDTFAAKARLDLMVSDAANLVVSPAELASNVLLAMEEIADFDALSLFVGDLPPVDDEPAEADPSETESEFQRFTNDEALNRLFARLAFAELVLHINADTFASFDEAVAVRGDLVSQLAEEELDDFATSFTGHKDLVELRTGLAEYITALAADLARIETVELDFPLPAVVLAYELHDDPTRDVEIIARNKVFDPLTVFGEVKVLSR
jgi:prophage DNA circulation protein